MTFYDARAISKAGLHVRRASWLADRWFMLWRGTWFAFAGGNPPAPVQASDYSADDLLATDWTTVPAALAACPIDPTIGSTGGGDPVPGTDGFPSDPTPPTDSYPGFPGTPGTTTVLPPPAPGTMATITFAGILSPDASGYTGVALNKTFTFSPAAGLSTTFQSGYDAAMSPLYWDVLVSRVGSLWSATISAHIPGDPSGGFDSHTAQASPIPNFFASSSGTYAYAGTATIGLA